MKLTTLFSEGMDFRTLGLPSSASHAAIWSSGDEFALFLQPADEVDLVEGDVEEVIVYFYGPNTKWLMDRLAVAGTAAADLHTRMRNMSTMVRHYHQIMLWYNPKSHVLLALPHPQPQAATDELAANRFMPLPIPWYKDAEQFASFQRREDGPESDFSQSF